MKDIVIVGTGGFAREVAFLLEEINRHERTWSLRGFISPTDELVGSTVGRYPVVGTDGWLRSLKEPLDVVVGIGDPKVIGKVATTLQANNHLHFPNLIHPTAVGDWERIQLGQGNLITAASIFTTDIVVGSFNVFNLNVTVGHDASIGDYNVLNPTVNISGAVKMGDRILVGTGAQILQQLKIASDSIIGAGAVVSKSILEPGTYVGIPAKKLEKK
jgi:sugar O-acyltransferase (sialic acid O-acetyltransferase NeuD family)